MQSRCLNLSNFWSYPSDLTDIDTLQYLISPFDSIQDLCGAELYGPKVMDKILYNIYW